MRKTINGVAAAIGMGILILDSRTAIEGARTGIDLCIRTVIPSLFPFFLLSIMLTGSVIARRLGFLGPICRLCKIPQEAQSLLLTGFLGGYPVGAQCVSQAYMSGQLSDATAARMLSFCNNCGPAFLFGMAAALFDEVWICWVLWAIQIISALITAVIVPGRTARSKRITSGTSTTFVQALDKALRVMASVCGWVVIFRVVICFFERWILWYLPVEIQVAISGILELSNGCVGLHQIKNQGLRLILCAGILSFGGVCVALQTWSVVSPQLDKRYYFPGKILQSCISILLAWIVQRAFTDPVGAGVTIPIAAMIGIITLFFRKSRKFSSISEPIRV